MENNNLLSKNFKTLQNSHENILDIMEDPLNQINKSLNKLIINLNNENTDIYNNINTDLNLDKDNLNNLIKNDDVDDEDKEIEEIFNSYKLQDNYINNMNSNLNSNNISKIEKKDEILNNYVIPSNQFASSKTLNKSNKNIFNYENNYQTLTSPKRSISNVISKVIKNRILFQKFVSILKSS